MHQYYLEDVTKLFGRGQAAVRGINLVVDRGERVALIGPSGAGKTTLFRLLNCTLRPTTGMLRINGDETGNLHGKKLLRVRSNIGTIYQQHNLVPRLKVVHNVLSGRLGRWSTFRSLASLVKPSDIDMAHEALNQVGIPDRIFDRTDELSGGQQQRVAIARVLVQNPEVILADEPVSSVDPSLANAIVQLLIEISRNARKSLIASLHSIDLALAYFPRIVGIKQGKVLFDLSPDNISDDLLAELYGAQSSDPKATEPS
ncbi:MAG: phosphonate ABC transporter ATP-binding protein [Desulfobacterales bacterium]|nr:phosphonate ABC transporter ATP-binding protein [Desulfobacterales bacterium]